MTITVKTGKIVHLKPKKTEKDYFTETKALRNL